MDKAQRTRLHAEWHECGVEHGHVALVDVFGVSGWSDGLQVWSWGDAHGRGGADKEGYGEG